MALNNHDLAESCQWLFNEGQKEKEDNIRILDPLGALILAESEITSNIQ